MNDLPRIPTRSLTTKPLFPKGKSGEDQNTPIARAEDLPMRVTGPPPGWRASRRCEDFRLRGSNTGQYLGHTIV
jgi:hypothetical protein